MEALHAVHESFGDALGTNKKANRPVAIILTAPLRKLADAITIYAVQMPGFAYRDPEKVAAVADALSPIDEFRAAANRRITSADEDAGRDDPTRHRVGPGGMNESSRESVASSLARAFSRYDGPAVPPRSDLLLATPTFSVSVSPDGTSLVIETDTAYGHMSVPVPTATLHDIVVRTEAPHAVRYEVPTGITPSAAACWIELVFLRERPWSLGPLAAEDAAALVQAFRTWRRAHPIDEQPTVVDAEQLAAAPSAWHSRRIDVTATWYYAFERSGFVGAWLEAPAHAPVTYGTYRARVIGTWIHPEPDAGKADGHGHMGCWPGVLHAETIEILEVLERQPAQLDGLTGLPKRDAIGTAFAQARRPLGLALLDIDWLKRINDQHGHAVGDEVLRGCAAAITGAVRPDDIVVRWGGEEFAILLPDATLEIVRELAEQVLADVRALVVASDTRHVPVTISAGVVEVAPGETFATAIERADRALYEAKTAGRNRVVTGPRFD